MVFFPLVKMSNICHIASITFTPIKEMSCCCLRNQQGNYGQIFRQAGIILLAAAAPVSRSRVTLPADLRGSDAPRSLSSFLSSVGDGKSVACLPCECTTNSFAVVTRERGHGAQRMPVARVQHRKAPVAPEKLLHIPRHTPTTSLFFPPLASSPLMLFSKRREGLCFCSECRSHEAREWVSLKVSKHGWAGNSNKEKTPFLKQNILLSRGDLLDDHSGRFLLQGQAAHWIFPFCSTMVVTAAL